MENTKTSLKRKLLITLFSALICVLVIGVSVYAALTQTVTLNNNITITTSGQTKVQVVVSEGSNAASTGITEKPASEPLWSEVTTKAANQDSGSGSLTPIDFSVSDGINYYAYKIEFTNEGTETSYAHITADAIDNTQLTIYTGETWGSLSAIGNNKAIDADVTLATTDGTGSFYIVVASNVDLAELDNMDQTPFNVTITIDQSNS